MTDIREQIAEYFFELHDATNSDWTRFINFKEAKDYTWRWKKTPDVIQHTAEYQQCMDDADQILSLPLTKVCPECDGRKREIIDINEGATTIKVTTRVCPTCKGTGEVTITLENLVKEWEK